MSVKERMNLSGRVALVTGASQGIGAAIALALAEFGADVAISCQSRSEAAERVARDSAALGVRSATVYASLDEDDGACRTYDQAVHGLGQVDILVLNASVQSPAPWLEGGRSAFDGQVAVNLRSSIELIQLCVPQMRERGWGRVLTIGSVQERRPHPDMLVYAATKSAQESVSRNLARQLGRYGITVNNLAPGVINTPRSTDRLIDPAYRQQVIDAIPARRLGEPVDCAGAAVLLCSDAGRYINGANLFVDGGLQHG